MSALWRIAASIYVDLPDHADPEHVAGVMHDGLKGALEQFPIGEVAAARVTAIEPVTDAEANEMGLTE